MYQRGDIVLLPFPFTDLSATRTRPAVVVSREGFEQETGDFTVAMITSVPRTTSFDYELKELAGREPPAAIVGAGKTRYT